MFFSFDGLDGVGKSTQIKRFCEWLRGRGHNVITCRDPGSTPLGERVRDLLLHSGEDVLISNRAEMLLYMAARAQLVDEVIRPALERGDTVVSDRFLMANLVYQSHAGGLPLDETLAVGAVATAGVMPNGVILLDMTPEEADRRINRERDRMESRGDDYRRRLREGFLAEAERAPDHVVVIDAIGSVDEVHERVLAAVTPRWGG